MTFVSRRKARQLYALPKFHELCCRYSEIGGKPEEAEKAEKPRGVPSKSFSSGGIGAFKRQRSLMGLTDARDVIPLATILLAIGDLFGSLGTRDRFQNGTWTESLPRFERQSW
jgi:hypothetical protein